MLSTMESADRSTALVGYAKTVLQQFSAWKPVATTTVKMDKRHKHIQWLLKREEERRGSPPHFPGGDISNLILKVQREDDERVLAQFKRCSYAYAEVEDVDAEEYGEVDEQDPEYQEARLQKEKRKEVDVVIASLVKQEWAALELMIQSNESEEEVAGSGNSDGSRDSAGSGNSAGSSDSA